MTVRFISCSVLLAALAVAMSGCCGDPFACKVGCHDGGCGIDDSCTGCDDVGCGPCSGPGPIQALKEIVHGGGCGAFYWDEWMSDPPYKCDPCDDHGHWTGPRCCPPRFWDALWGRRGVGCTCGACLEHPVAAHHHGEFIDGEVIEGEMIEGEVIYDGPVIDQSAPAGSGTRTLQPTPAPQSAAPKRLQPRQFGSQRVYYERARSSRR